jgi:hypothetical protein
VLVDKLIALHADSVLGIAAERGLITELACQMPECRCPEGRNYFEERRGRRSKWAPSADRFPIPGRDGGLYAPDNVRLSHASCNFADGGRATRGIKRTAEMRAKSAAAQTARMSDPANRAALSVSITSHFANPTNRVRQSEALTGHEVSEVTRAKLSAANLGNQNALGNQYWIGRKHTNETRAKMSIAAKARAARKHTEREG